MSFNLNTDYDLTPDDIKNIILENNNLMDENRHLKHKNEDYRSEIELLKLKLNSRNIEIEAMTDVADRLDTEIDECQNKIMELTNDNSKIRNIILKNEEHHERKIKELNENHLKEKEELEFFIDILLNDRKNKKKDLNIDYDEAFKLLIYIYSLYLLYHILKYIYLL